MKVLKKEMQEFGKKYVYLAEFESGFCKIGYSDDPKKRLKNVSIRNQVPIKDYVLVEGYNELENILHRIFKTKRRYSEFFEINFIDLVNFVKNFKYEYIPKEKESSNYDDDYNIDNYIYYVVNKKKYKCSEFLLILKKENATEFKLVKKLFELENEFRTFIKHDLLFSEIKLLDLIDLKKRYITFLNNQVIKLGDESAVILEINKNLKFCCLYLVKNY